MRGLSVVLFLLLGLGLGQKPLQYPVDRPFGASLPLRSGSAARVELSLKPSSHALELRLSKRTQSLTVGTLSDGFSPPGAVLATDFNFDGWLDLALPMATGYGGVNFFYEIYFYDPLSRGYVLLRVPGEYDGQFCNPEVSRGEKALLTSCKTGPSYAYADYKFAAGQPYLYRTSQLYPLSGFGCKDDLIFYIRTFNAKGQLMRELWSDGPRQTQVASRVVVQPRLPLYPRPDPKVAPNGYLVRGDRVEVLGLNTSDYAWVKVAYQSRAVGRIVRWVHVP
ncbi:MAG: hypothetical protein K6T57_03650 [Thermaceae bacterium]|nr:hypothetical protein [Thermaceae bacterium]